jgi:hypothetical protein
MATFINHTWSYSDNPNYINLNKLQKYMSDGLISQFYSLSEHFARVYSIVHVQILCYVVFITGKLKITKL